jgi:hypothetical protein
VRANVLISGLIVCSRPVLSPAPALARAIPVATQVAGPQSSPASAVGDWLWEGVMEKLTIPLGPFRPAPRALDFCASLTRGQ